jgi:hypothetical protein
MNIFIVGKKMNKRTKTKTNTFQCPLCLQTQMHGSVLLKHLKEHHKVDAEIALYWLFRAVPLSSKK